MSNKIRILIVDDERIIRVSLTSLLGDYPQLEVIGEAENGEIAVQLARTLMPDLILMDLGMDNVNGIEATRRIRELKLSTKILVLTGHIFRKNEVLDSLIAGADGYASKDLETYELVKAIETVSHGAIWIDPKVAPIIREEVFKKIIKQ